jgi:hypothetical protein
MFRRTALALGVALALAACAPSQDLSQPPEPLGDYSMGFNVVVVDHPKVAPFSRTVPDAAWKAALEQALDERFSRFHGSGTYHIAIKLEVYSLGAPGVPLVFSPKTALGLSANVWSTRGKLNPKPEGLTVFEGLSDKSIIGSGLTQSADEQMRKLAFNAAAKIEDWLRQHPEWFRPDAPVVPGTEPKPPA